MPAPRIIAKDRRDANRFAQETLGLSSNSFRIVGTPASLSGFGYTLHLAPGWKKCPHYFALVARLKFKRNITIIDHENQASEAESVVVVDSNTEPTGEWDALVEQMAQQAEESDAEAQSETPDPEEIDAEAGETESSEDAEGSEGPKRRRRRCKECGILVDPDEVEAHAAEHAE
jgi:hypothetical protein